MRCIVINLARAAARRQAITEQLRALDMEFEILNAKDWQELTEHDYASVDAVARERQGRRALSSGMIACAISHRWAFEELLSGEADMAVIVEDDVTLSLDFKQFLGVVENTGVDFDVIFLHRNKPENTFLPVERIGKRRLGLVKYSDWGAMGYIITRNAVQRYFERVPKIVHQIDHSLYAYWEHGLKIFSLDSPVVHHGNQSGSHSYRQEIRTVRRYRPVTELAKRLRTELREGFRERRIFKERIRELRNRTS